MRGCRYTGSKTADFVPFPVGTRVEARYGGKTKWYVGTIEKVDEKTVDIVYLDGDREEGVSVELVRAFVPYDAGATVEARYGGKKKYYPGVVISVDESTWTYEIRYDDGDVETVVIHRYLRGREKPAGAKSSG